MDAVERIDILSKKFTSQVVAAILGIDQAQVVDVRLAPAAGESMVNPGGPIIVVVGGPIAVSDPTGQGPKGIKLTTIELPQPCHQIILSACATEFSIQAPSEYEPQLADFSIVALPAGRTAADLANPALFPHGQFLTGLPLAEPDDFPGYAQTVPFNGGQPVVTVTPPPAPYPATQSIDLWLATYTDNTGQYPMGLTLPKGIEIHVA